MKKYIKWISITLVLIFVSVFGTIFFLPKPSLLNDYSFSQAFYDEKHHLLRLTLSDDDKYRLFVPLKQISPLLISTTLLQEDQYFYKHFGINPFALVKAIWQTYILKTRRIGASTITMQLARIHDRIHSKTWTGKIKQIVRAFQFEMHYSKDQILEAYLNLAPYGNNIEGVGAASLIYFNKSVKQLALPEALTLAVIPQNPIQRTPKQKNLKTVRDRLFNRWVNLHPQDKNQKMLIELPLQMQSMKNLPFLAPHLINQILETKENKSQEVVTTLNLSLQRILEKVTQHYLVRKKNIGVYNAAVLLVDTRDMSVKAMIGSADFFNPAIGGQINGTNIKRSPGSTLKPFIYALALDQGLIHPDTILKDVPRSFGSYNPENFDYDFMGPIHAKDALILSRNIPAIYLIDQLKQPNLYELLQEAEVKQLKSESYYGLALALGSAELTMQELTSLYAMLLNNGTWQPLRFTQNEKQLKHKKLLSPEVSFLVVDMLTRTNRPDDYNNDKMSVAWKTGTSSGYRDAWSIGIVGPYILAVWVGNFDNSSNPAFVGKNIAAPLFFELISVIRHETGKLATVEKNLNELNLTKVAVCKASGLLPTRYCHDQEMSWFIPGKSPIKTDNIYREVAINKKNGLRTCHFGQDTQFEIYEFWPSDLLRIFKEAGIQRRVPPPFESGCSLIANKGLSPQISSPQSGLIYVLHAEQMHRQSIPLTAIVDADVTSLHWFIDNIYLGTSSPEQPYLWVAKPGKFVIRVIDDHGRSDAQDLIVQINN